MSRTTNRFASLSLALLACTGTAVAQQAGVGQNAGQTAPSAQPPVTERIEPGSDVPATTIEPRRGTQITEKRGNDGNVTEVEVQSGRSNYILRPNTAPGNAQPGDAQSSGFRAPQWKVMEFDLNAKKKAAGAEAAEAAANDATPAKPASGAPAGKVPPATVPMTRPADIPPPPPLPANGR